MKLAYALSERSDLMTRISQLKERLCLNAKVQEGEQPSEDPNELLKELNEDICRLEDLIYRINETNSKTVCDGVSITQLLAKRDALLLKDKVLRDFAAGASALITRYSTKEIKILSTVNVKDLQKDIDANAKEIRQIDEKIQELNWLTELL